MCSSDTRDFSTKRIPWRIPLRGGEPVGVCRSERKVMVVASEVRTMVDDVTLAWGGNGGNVSKL